MLPILQNTNSQKDITMVKNILIWGLLCNFYVTAYSMESTQQSTTHNNSVITADNLYELSLKMPSDLAQQVKTCFAKPKTKEIITKLLSLNICSNGMEFEAFKGHKTQYANATIKNKSKYNYIFCPEGQNFMIRIAGPLNVIRTKTASVYHIDPYDQTQLTAAKFSMEKVTSSHIPVYQHTSCVATYLRISEIAPYLKHIKCIPTYLHPITPEPQKPCSDNNYVVIQEQYDEQIIVELKKLSNSDKKRIMTHLPDLAFKELFCVINVGPLWNLDVDTNLLMNSSQEQELVIGDFEQPNNSDSSLFFYKGEKGKQKYEDHAQTAIGMMQSSLEKYAPEKGLLWQELRKQDWRVIVKELKGEN